MESEKTITGHAAIFFRPGDASTQAEIGGQFTERIACGAFSQAIARSPSLAALTNHDPSLLLGRLGTTPLSLRVVEDGVGLSVRVFPLGTQAGRDALSMVESRAMRGMSFSFVLENGGHDAWSFENGRRVRTINNFGEIYDVGPVTYPAYKATSCGVEPAYRSVAQKLDDYQTTAHRVQAAGTNPRGKAMSQSRSIVERADDRSRGYHAGDLMTATKLRLYASRARLVAELENLQPWESQRAAEIQLEMRELAAEERGLEAAIERR
jgi:hypothetical protein